MSENYNYPGNENGNENNDRQSVWNSDDRYQTHQSDYVYGQENNSMDPGRKERRNREKKSGGFFKKAVTAVCLGLFFGLFAGVGFYAVTQFSDLLPSKEKEQPAVSGQLETTAESDEESKSGIRLSDTDKVTVVSSDVTSVVEEVMPAMVSIINNYTETSTNFFGQSFSQDAASSGSGIIVAESETELLIVTNHHVVKEAKQLDVTFIDGETAVAQIKGMNSGMDLAVIAIPLESLKQETKDAIVIASLGDSAGLKLGEPVVAIGNALGYGQSVTAGIVSALDREVTMDDGSKNQFIQTDAAINPGNSGGALLNVKGEVIGINSSKIGATAVEGICYAIPISAAKPIISELMLKETRNKVEEDQKGYLGISMQTVPAEYTQMYKTPSGVFVLEVTKGSPAEAAGLTYGDIIVEFEGEKISTYQDLQNIIQYYGAGSEVEITVKRLRGGEYQTETLKVTLANWPKE